MTVSVGWIVIVVFTAEMYTWFSWTLSGLVGCFGCRHQRTYVPSGHRSSARNTFGSGHTHVRLNELCELDRRHSSTVTSSFKVDSKYRFSKDSLTSVSIRETNTFANRLAAFMVRSVALPMITRLFVVIRVVLVVGLPLSAFVASFLRLWGTVCHSGMRVPGSAVAVCRSGLRAVAKLTPALGRCTGCCVSCAASSVAMGIDTQVITVASAGLALTSFDFATREEDEVCDIVGGNFTRRSINSVRCELRVLRLPMPSRAV